MKTIVVKLAVICSVFFFMSCTDNTEEIIDTNIELTPNKNEIIDKLGLSYTDPDDDGTQGEDEQEAGKE